MFGVWKKLVPTVPEDLGGFRPSTETVTTEVVETARELELEVGREDGPARLPSHDQTWTDEELLLVDEPGKWIVELESAPGSDAMKSVAVTTKDLESNINLPEKAAAALSGLTLILKEILWVKHLNLLLCYKEILYERKSQSMWQTFLSSFKKLPQPPPACSGTALISQPPSAGSQDSHPQERDYDLLKF